MAKRSTSHRRANDGEEFDLEDSSMAGGERQGSSNEESEAAGSDGDPKRSSSSIERKGVLVRMPRDLWRELRIHAMDQNKTLQAVMVEAARDYLDARS